MIPYGITTILLSLGLGAFGAWLVSRHAASWGLMDFPDERKSHRVPTPRGGGAGISLAVILAAVLCHIPTVLWAPAAIIAFTGFADDRWEVSVRARLLVQLGCAALTTAFLLDADGSSGVLILLGLFWVIFITGTTNFFNFMDGINGNAAIGGAVTFGALGAYTVAAGLPPAEFWFNLSVAAACLGFLPFNINRARVFMGDTGSVLLGFVFAAQVLRYAEDFTRLLILSSFLFLFYLDTLTTLLMRWREGKRLTEPHRCHLYQIVANQMGYPHWRVALGYGVVQTAISGTLFLAIGMPPLVAVGDILVWSALFVSFTHIVRRGYGKMIVA
jgi:Fuc2NAc and GlcNAc transferase